MRKIHCNGCGKSEDLSDETHTIQTVIISVMNNDSSWMTPKQHETDICPSCQEQMLKTYFEVNDTGPLKVHSLIEPRSLRLAE